MTRADGNFVYSFSAEKQRESDTPRTLHAVVNEGENSNANVELSNNRLTQDKSIVNTNSTQETEKYTKSGKKDFSIPEIEDEVAETEVDIVSKAERLSSEYNNGEISREVTQNNTGDSPLCY